MSCAAVCLPCLTGPSGEMVSADLKGSAKLGQYLRGLRLGYGYSLRRVEEKARQHGGDIDNSQLSRYEKGLCYPSFDKLRTLGRIFNVSIQAFSDVVDLEELEENQPAGNDAAELLREAHRDVELGDYGRAYACCQKARTLLEHSEQPSSEETIRAIAKARLAAAITLVRMSKLSLAEYELRQTLRRHKSLDPSMVAGALIQLCSVHRSFGDFLLAETEAARALAIAEECGGELLKAQAHHSLGVIAAQQRDTEQALVHMHESLSRYRALGDLQEALRVKVTLGSLYADRGQVREGIRLLKEVQDEARTLGARWTLAVAGAWLGEIHYRREDYEAARRAMRESNTIASSGDVQYVDVLFVNAFYLWQIAKAENNATEVKIALGRLKFLRPHLEHDIPEVRTFDAYMEKGGAQ